MGTTTTVTSSATKAELATAACEAIDWHSSQADRLRQQRDALAWLLAGLCGLLLLTR